MKVAVDTNVLVRLIVDDESAQADSVARLAREHQLVVTSTALLETEWVLRRVLGLDRSTITAGFERLLGLNTATFLLRDRVVDAVEAFRSGCDFADALHAATATGADIFATFDRTFVRRAGKLDYLLPVRLVGAVAASTGDAQT